jgi:hypothetical protein
MCSAIRIFRKNTSLIQVCTAEDVLKVKQTEQRSWLRHYATGQGIAGSMPDEEIERLEFP